MRVESLCQKCGREIPYWQAHGQPITFIGGFVAELCLDCRNALTKAIYEDPDGLGKQYVTCLAQCEAAEHGGRVAMAETYAALLWELQRLLFNFMERWIAKGQGAEDVSLV